MKRNIKKAFVMVSILLAGYGIYSSQKNNLNSDLALANSTEKNPMCPNGCSGPGDGCYCYGWQENLAEG